MASDDLRARMFNAVNPALNGFFVPLSRRQAVADALLATAQPELDRLRAACRSAAVLLRATADHRPDPTALRAAARDLDEVAGPEPTQPTTEE